MGRARVWLIVALLCTPGSMASAQAPPLPADGWVVLPIDEYRALRDRTRAQAAQPTSPVEATLTRVDYELGHNGESIAGRVLLTIDVLRDGWARVQIPAGLMAREARLDGQLVPLVKGPPPHVLLARPGRSVLEMDVAFPLATTAGTESIALPQSASPITRVTLVLPRSGVELSAGGGVVADRAETADESRWTAFGQPNQPLALSWKRRVDDRRTEMPLRFRARIAEVVGLGEDASSVTASVRIEVLQGLASAIVLSVPDELVVNQVSGATVGEWSLAAGTLRVQLLEPVATEAAFVVQAEFRAPREGRVVVPLVRAPAAERESGGVAVDVIGAGEISGRQARGLEPSDPSEVGDVVAGPASPSVTAFRMRPLAGTVDRSLSVTVVRYTLQAVLIANIEEARYRVLGSEDGRTLVEARYAVRNNQRSFLKVTLPSGAAMWSAAVAGRPMRPGAAEVGAVLLPLEKGRLGEEAQTFIVSVVYLQSGAAWPERGRLRMALPALDLPISRTGIELHYPPRYDIALPPGSMRIERDSGPFAEAFRRPQAPAPSTPPGAPGRGPALSSAATPETAGPGLQMLVDRYQSDSGVRTVVGSLPVNVTFPSFGPSVFLASELTAEGTAPAVDLDVKRSTR